MNGGSCISLDKPVDSLGKAFSKDIRPFIDVIDNLRRFGLQQDINLPNVVVVGDQSSGKSSIIEAISGIELPRGKNIVTRCPLELQLKKVVNKPWKATLTYKTLEGVSEKVEVFAPQEVEKHIREAQTKMCRTSKGVSAELITLRVESSAETAPDLTLIDLPGIARIAIEDQPVDICQQIKKIIMRYVENENTVILCVVSAHLDAAVNESIQIAKEVDPKGIRTFGVITKPDIADEEIKEEVLCLLNNEKIRLEKGYHMVKCRSQKELESNLGLDESLENEKKFFQDDKYYRTANKTLLGTMNLASKITEELVQVIQSNLPELEKKINSELREAELKLAKLPLAIPENNQGKLIYLLEMINDMNRQIYSLLTTGKINYEDKTIFQFWRNLFKRFTTEIENMKTEAMENEFSAKELKDEISRKRSNEISGFLNFELFQGLIKKHVMLYKSNAEAILKEVCDATDTVLTEIIKTQFEHLPAIESELKIIAFNELDRITKETLERINITFEEEKLVFVTDEAIEKELKNSENSEKPDKQNKTQSKSSSKGLYDLTTPVLDKQFTDADEMHNLIDCYLKLVHVRLSDRIPTTIRQCFHIEFNKSLDKKFVEYATSEGVLKNVTENSKLDEDRKNLQDKIERLHLAKTETRKL